MVGYTNSTMQPDEQFYDVYESIFDHVVNSFTIKYDDY